MYVLFPYSHLKNIISGSENMESHPTWSVREVTL